VQRFVGHPDDGRLELVGGLRRRVGGGDDIAARAVDFVGQAERHRLAGDGLIQIAIQGDDARDRAGLARGQDADGIARA
jgi:hypothetical protein